MKRNAIARIIVLSLILLVLTGILVAALVGRLYFTEYHSGTAATGEVKIDPSRVSGLEISWAAGTVTIKTADTPTILISEEGNSNSRPMVYNIDEGKLEIYHSFGSVGFTAPEKDLTVIVPIGWKCRELDIDAAGVEVNIDGLWAESVDLDGAGLDLSYDGKFTSLKCDGAGCTLDIIGQDWPELVEINGAGCDVELTLPHGCGFVADLDGLGCAFASNAESSRRDGKYVYGNEFCEINADGLGIAVNVLYGPFDPLPTEKVQG